MGKSKLRVGILLDDFTQPAWVARVLRDIRSSSEAEIALVVKRESPPVEAQKKRGGLAGKIVRNRHQLLPLLYNAIDARKFAVELDPFADTDIAPLVENVPVVRVTPRTTAFSDYFPDAEADAIDAYQLDVALRFGFRILRGRALKIARYGVWSYHHGDNRVNRGGPPGFWEVMEGTPVTGSILQILTEDLDGGRVLYRSWAATDRMSVVRNKANYYWKSSAFVMRKLRELYDRGTAAIEPEPDERSDWEMYGHRLYKAPRNTELVRPLARLARQSIGGKLDRVLTHDQWTLAYHIGASQPGSFTPAQSVFRFKPLIPPHDRFWADPFVVENGDGWTIFFEELVYADVRAHISALDVNRDGTLGEPYRVLVRDYHLSYPFVFQWNGDWWMIPESGANRTVELWRATSFPREWTLDRVLLEGEQIVDATLLPTGDRWWMFANIAERGASRLDELHLFSAPSPLGPFTPHKRNPVKSDVRSARPAGRPFCFKGAWYRPAQDCSVSYGWAISMQRIERIDDEAYREVEVSRLEPRWLPNLTGTHTINAAGGLTVIDARMKRRRFP